MLTNQLFKKYRSIVLGILTIAVGTSGCGVADNQIENKESNNKEVLEVMVSIDPQKYFVEKIGGDRVKVDVMVSGSAEPHTYEPKPQQLRYLSEAEAYIIVGGNSFESAWLERIKNVNDNLEIIDSGKGIERIKINSAHHHHDHHHHDSHHHDVLEGKEEKKESGNPHIWLAPELVKIQAQNIYNGLVELDPENQLEYQKNLQEFISEIEEVDSKIEANLVGIKNRKFIVFHPAWTYFAREYQLEEIPIEVEGTEPTPSELKALIEEAKEENIKIIFIEPQFSQRSAKVIAQEIGGEVITINPLAEDWANNLVKVSEVFGRELSKNPKQKIILLAFQKSQNDIEAK